MAATAEDPFASAAATPDGGRAASTGAEALVEVRDLAKHFPITSGILFAWSFPNVDAGWLMFIALFPLFVALARVESYRGAFALGWLSQGIAWLLMVPWVIRVMSHYGGLPYITGVLIFVAMCAYLGMYGGLFALLFYRIAPGARFRCRAAVTPAGSAP